MKVKVKLLNQQTGVNRTDGGKVVDIRNGTINPLLILESVRN